MGVAHVTSSIHPIGNERKYCFHFTKNNTCINKHLENDIKFSNERSHFKRVSLSVRASESNFVGFSDDNDMIFGAGRL